MRHPSAHIDWVVEPGFAPLVRRVAGIGEVIECAQRRWRKRWWSTEVRREKQQFRERLRARAYDAVVDLQGLTKSALVVLSARRRAPGGLRYALGNRTDGSGWEAPTRWVADRPIEIEPRIHVVDRSRHLCAEAFGTAIDTPPRFGLQAATRPDPARPLMVLVHGTSRDDKLWPETHWIDFGRRRVGEGWHLALPQADAVEAARAARIAAAIGDAHCTLWPKMSLDAIVDRFGAAQAVVGVDSGLSRTAVALDRVHLQLYNFPTSGAPGRNPAATAISISSVSSAAAGELRRRWSEVEQAAAGGAVNAPRPHPDLSLRERPR
ncbi:MAG: lipopolysaccharide heptosyltransferase I [Sphaerotilus natans]